MTDLWFVASADPSAQNGGSGPDPITPGDTSWTWDVEFTTASSQWTYGRSSMNSFVDINGDAWVLSGIVEYRTRGADGVDTVHAVGQANPDGVVDYMLDSAVDSVTFGWTIHGDGFCEGRVNMEIWVTG